MRVTIFEFQNKNYTKKQMKKLISIILIFVLTFSAVACQNNIDDSNKQSEKKQEIQEQTPPVEEVKKEEAKKQVIPTSDMKVALENWPKIDGATAFLPYYTGVAASLRRGRLPIWSLRL